MTISAVQDGEFIASHGFLRSRLSAPQSAHSVNSVPSHIGRLTGTSGFQSGACLLAPDSLSPAARSDAPGALEPLLYFPGPIQKLSFLACLFIVVAAVGRLRGGALEELGTAAGFGLLPGSFRRTARLPACDWSS